MYHGVRPHDIQLLLLECQGTVAQYQRNAPKSASCKSCIFRESQKNPEGEGRRWKVEVGGMILQNSLTKVLIAKRLYLQV